MKKTFLLALLPIALILSTSQKASALWLCVDGASKVTNTGFGTANLDCLSASWACCSINFVTLEVVVYNIQPSDGNPLDGEGNPVLIPGNTTASLEDGSYTENPDADRTATMVVSNLQTIE